MGSWQWAVGSEESWGIEPISPIGPIGLIGRFTALLILLSGSNLVVGVKA